MVHELATLIALLPPHYILIIVLSLLLSVVGVVCLLIFVFSKFNNIEYKDLKISRGPT